MEKMNKSIYVKNITSLFNEEDGLAKLYKDLTDNLPISFVENTGQTNHKAQYHVSCNNFNAFLNPNSIVFSYIINLTPKYYDLINKSDLAGLLSAPISIGQLLGTSLRMKFQGFSQRCKIKSLNKNLSTTVNYYYGKFPEGSHECLQVYNTLCYEHLWQGIDLSIDGTSNTLNYHFSIEPGAKAKNIRFSYEGAEKVYLDEQGNLVVSTPLVRIIKHMPISYQIKHRKKQKVKCSFKVLRQLTGETVVYLSTGKDYDPSYPLYIEFSMENINLQGEYANNTLLAISKSSSGDLYTAGCSTSLIYPPAMGIFDVSFNGSNLPEVFASKFSIYNKVPLYYTYIKGDGVEQCLSIASDPLGQAYITGTTSSKNFPVTRGTFDTLYNGNFDAYVAKLSHDNGTLMYSTFLGGNGNDISLAIAVDRNGSACITGQTSSPCFPSTRGVFNPLWNGGIDAFITRLSPDGTNLEFSTFLGGILDDTSFAIALDSIGDVYIVGCSCSPDFPNTKEFAALSLTLNNRLYIAKLTSSGHKLLSLKILEDTEFK